MNSDSIYEYSDEFLTNIIENLISLKIKKMSNPSNNDFDNRLKSILGKNFNENDFKNANQLNDKELKNKVFKKFQDSREERAKLLNENQSKEIEKRIFLQTIDLNWKSHIQYLEQLRQVIGLRSYGQRDPLIEYKKEAFTLFENLLNKLKFDYITILMNLRVVETKKEKEENIQSEKINPAYKGKKMRRNEPCFCGSGKKYKHCCGSI